MGRAGHVQTRPPEYGSSISDWVQTELYDYLSDRGFDIGGSGDDADRVEQGDHWEIAIPERERADPKPGERRYYYDYDFVRRTVADLRAHPDTVLWDGSPYGEEAADLLQEGLDAAIEHDSGFIVIDWW